MKQQLTTIDGIEKRRIVAALSREQICGLAHISYSTYHRILAGAVLADRATIARLQGAVARLVKAHNS